MDTNEPIPLSSEIPLSNFQKWRHYTQGLNSPDSYINFSWYYLVASSLQRRVFVGAKHKPIFPNVYIILVGEPGIGKGLVITEVAKFLKHHKLSDPSDRDTVVTGDKKGDVQSVDRAVMEATAAADYMAGQSDSERGSIFGKKYKTVDKPLLFPLAAEATSYEALVMAMSRALRRKNFFEYSDSLGRNVGQIYTHSSLAFCLEEISSLFRKNSHDVSNFLLTAYDCGDYTKDTKTQGTDRIQKCCLNFLGGTTPTFMRRTFSDGLLNDGFSSRGWFIYEAINRKDDFFIPELNDNQKQYEQDLLAHIKQLSTLYGQVKYTPEAEKFLEEWWLQAALNRPNINEKLKHYYARKKTHVQKFALAIHFSESIEMTVGIDSCKQAILMLESVERNMHHALMVKADNPYYEVGVKILKYLASSNPQSEDELLARFWEDLPSNNPKEGFGLAMEHYISIGKIKAIENPGKRSLYTVVKEVPKSQEPSQT